MKGWLAIAFAATATTVALLAPPAYVALVAIAAWASLLRGHRGMLGFAAFTLALNAALLAWLYPGDWQTGAQVGLVAGLRLVALLIANVAVLQWLPPAQWLADLGLPRRVEAFLAAILMASHDIGRDARLLLDAQQARGTWPKGRMARARVAAGLLPALMVAAHQRAKRRQEALRLAGVDVGPRFAPIVAITALAAAGRLALVAFPNISLTFVIVFAGGVALGARVGFWSGFWAMLLTDLMLSGLFLPAFVNVPTMALVGALGGAFHARHWQDRTEARVLAAATGILATLAWSVATDALSWAIIAERRQSIALLQVTVLAGLVFNAVPALVNGALFAAAIGPVGRAFSALRLPTAPPAPRP